ncbi:YARHG domain-containing protein [Pedobacter caeni]|uniref:YARHG domain-containing protein n=1 Tax=Pedobacter caeni TaxID=288992 RepID=A0A1M4U847_9SPHI|nr:YARHG domain-containing protein [Pedobacter caeni]SHE52905.1 YARHG domain-containing protein [Pedobacter caeni]
MKYILILFFFTLFSSRTFANDGAFYAKGNQLIPIKETDISVKKEILTLKKVNDKFIEVTVYYEFYNPKAEKTITVGFEAFSPSGDVDGTPKNGLHRYMHDFTVVLNDQKLNYKVAYVEDEAYARNGIIKSKSLAEIEESIDNTNEVGFFYVYHFKAKFKKGLNIIKHTYKYDVSGSVDYNYDFEYVLTAANRWGNKQIDDFTLIVDPGEFETFNLDKTFFKASTDWKIDGVGKVSDVKALKDAFKKNDALRFHLQKGKIIFQRKNFKPRGELFLSAKNEYGTEDLFYLPFSYYQQDFIKEPTDELQKKILKNLPFARRGYVFKSVDLKKYYEQMDWYIPNPSYVADLQTITQIEKDWLKKMKL